MSRNFKLVSPHECGPYTGASPKQAAQKAFTQLRKQNKVRGEVKFSIKETTKDSSRKIYKYRGKRNKLDEPQIVQFGSGKNATSVPFTHKDVIYREY